MATISEALAIAIQHHQAGRLQAAQYIYRQILAAEPDHADALHLLGAIAHQMGNNDVAVEYIGRAIALKGTDATFHNNLGAALNARGNLEQAGACYRRALELRPDFAEAHSGLGVVFQGQGNLDEAIACYRRALELKPDFAEAHSNLGVAFKDQGKLDEAIACCRRAVQLRPDYAEAYSNWGAACVAQGKLDDAVACYRRALQVQPDHAGAHWSLGLAYLLAGDWQRGWPENEWRWGKKESLPQRFPQPVWNGEPLAGKTILLHAEQGLGDTIQFVRYASVVRQRAAAVVVECQKPLVGLLAECPGIDHLVAQGDALPAFDVHLRLLSVPGVVKTTVETVPADIPYLFAKPALVERWCTKLAALDGFKIGISWQGNSKYRSDRVRSIPLRCFAPLAQIPGVRLISLQKGEGSEQVAAVRDLFPVVDFAEDLDQRSGPFMDTAAVMKNLDLVISPDTVGAHLAGALGVPVWVALPFAPDWRWLLHRPDSPWYPTMRLFRQKTAGDWAAVFAEIQAALMATRS
jgi:tetratricopeptide (TPR) repeat protein